MPGQRPGECGRRIAGRDACPTQMGGHSPQRSVSALPLPGASLGPQSDCPHCGQMWLKFIPLLPFALKSALCAAFDPDIHRIPCVHILTISGLEIHGAGQTHPAPVDSFTLPLQPSAKIALPHKRPQMPQHCVPSLRRCTDATQPVGGAHNPSQAPAQCSTALGPKLQRRICPAL